MIKLKPCPFCGGAATSSKETTDPENKFHWAWVGCQSCQAFINFINTPQGWLAAKDVWNGRATK